MPPSHSIAPPAHLVPVLIALVAVFGLYLPYEIWRWARGNSSELTAGQFRRRLAAGLLLEAALVMWLLGGSLTVHSDPRIKLEYLFLNMLLAMVPMLLAVREAAFVVRQYARGHNELVKRMARDPRRNGPV